MIDSKELYVASTIHGGGPCNTYSNVDIITGVRQFSARYIKVVKEMQEAARHKKNMKTIISLEMYLCVARPAERRSMQLVCEFG